MNGGEIIEKSKPYQQPAAFRAARLALGLTQDELGDIVERHGRTIAQYEAGREPIPRVVAYMVANLLEIRVND